MTRPVLLTVSGHIPPDLDEQVARGERPRADYRVMSAAFEADVVDLTEAGRFMGRIGRLVQRLGGAGPVLAWYCFRRRNEYDVIVTDGEQVGIPYAILCRLFGRRRAKHAMIVHILSTPSKRLLIRVFRCAPLVDLFVVYCSAQERHIIETHGVSPNGILRTSFMVDTKFFQPDPTVTKSSRRICSAGLERRDYTTLMTAIRGSDADVVIAAASPWSRQADSTADQAVPDNVTIRRLDLFELRELYAESQLVVMPLYDVDFQAGITTILEAMAMGIPVVVTRTAGQTDTVIDDVTGVYVAPGDAAALRRTIERLLDDTHDRERLGHAARSWAVEHADIEIYAQRLAGAIGALSS